jgi:hypothetical protein
MNISIRHAGQPLGETCSTAENGFAASGIVDELLGPGGVTFFAAR